MNYFPKWQFTKENAVPFKTQIEIIREFLLPLTEDKIFQEKKFSFYITKVYLTYVRLGVLVEEKNLKELQRVVSKYTHSLKLNPIDPEKPGENNGWDGTAKKTDFSFSKGCPDITEIFYTKYLESITHIGLDLHKNDLYPAIAKAIEVSFQIKPVGNLIPREVLDSYFREQSEFYKNMKADELDIFWGNCGFDYRQGSTEGAHFYYNNIIGIDPRGSGSPLNVLFSLVSILANNKITQFKIPRDNVKCSEAIAYIINNI